MNSSTNIPAREILWNVSSAGDQILMYLLFVISLVICIWGIWSRLKLWAAGTPDSKISRHYFYRLCMALDYIFSQRSVNRNPQARVFHPLIFWGFIVLVFTTTMVFIDHDLGIKIYHGNFYLLVTVLSDIFGAGLIFGVFYAYHYRCIVKPDRLHTSKADIYMLGILALLCIQGFGLEGMRIYVTNDPWALYSPIGYLTSLAFWSLSSDVVLFLHYLLWWWHAVTVFVFIALVPYSKLFHVLSSSANLFFRQIDRAKGALSYPGDIEDLIERAGAADAKEFRVGISNISDLSWKQRLDLDACTSCGRCQDVCPAYNSGKMLSPKWLILDTRDHLLSLQRDGKAYSKNENSTRFYGFPGFSLIFSLLDTIDSRLLDLFSVHSQPETSTSTSKDVPQHRANNSSVQNLKRSLGNNLQDMLAGEVLDENVFWSCTTCRACVDVCPVGIEHVDLIVETRRALTLMQGSLPQEVQGSLRAIETRGNPFGPSEERSDWAKGLNLRIVSAGDEVEILYWVGCVSAYDKRKQSIARSMVQILNASGLSWGILGNKEQCTGDPARRLGEENLFQSSAKKNLEILNSLSFKTVVANCPHCFNTLKNEYPQVGKLNQDQDIRVIHHSQLIQELLQKKLLRLKPEETEEIFTFHDPCYLGRYNDHYQEPREVLVQIGRTKIKEMKDSRQNGMCCGAGGGHFWMDMKQGQRVNEMRIEQAADTGAQTIATACPFCLHMMEDGIKLSDREQTLKVRDIAELVADALSNNQSGGN